MPVKKQFVEFLEANMLEYYQTRNAGVTINVVHPGIVKTGIIRAHKGFLTGTFTSWNSVKTVVIIFHIIQFLL